MTRQILSGLIGIILCSQLIAQGPKYADRGSHEVHLVATVRLLDDSRNKTIDALVRHPDGEGPFPIVVFSHGALANKEAFGIASEHWASHGYIVIHPNHADARGGESPGQLKQRRAAGGTLGALTGGGRIDRVQDITSILDSLDQLEIQIPELKGKLNRKAIAVAGHSYGAYVAQCHGGVKTMVDDTLQNLSDSRVRCVVPISAQGESENFGLTSESWTEAKVAALHITGTRDRSAPERPGERMGDFHTKKIPFDRSPPGDKYLLVIEGANHISFGGRLPRLRGSADAPGLTKTLSLAFLEALLKKDADAKAWLDGQASSDWIGSQGMLERK
jgi:predicted dienelactone hydrolase